MQEVIDICSLSHIHIRKSKCISGIVRALKLPIHEDGENSSTNIFRETMCDSIP